MDVIVDSINVVIKCIFFSIGVISKAANCCPDIMSGNLAILDKLAEVSFDIGVL
jgi:hypothetical protein